MKMEITNLKKYFKVRISFRVVAGYTVFGILSIVFFYIFFLKKYVGIFKDGFTVLIVLASILYIGAVITRYIKGELNIEEEGLKTGNGFIKFEDIREILISDEKRWQRIMRVGNMIIVGNNVTVEIKNIDKPEELSDLLTDLRGIEN